MNKKRLRCAQAFFNFVQKKGHGGAACHQNAHHVRNYTRRGGGPSCLLVLRKQHAPYKYFKHDANGRNDEGFGVDKRADRGT